MAKKRVAASNVSSKNRKEARMIEMDSESDDIFWERVMNNHEMQWSMVVRSLTVTAEERDHQKERARLLVEHWRQLEKDKHVDAKQPMTKSSTAERLLCHSLKAREKLARLGNRYIATALVYKEQAQKDRVDEKTIGQQIWTTIKEMREQRRTLQVAIDIMESLLKAEKGAIRKRDLSTGSGCSYETLVQQLNEMKEQKDGREALVSQLQEKVKELDSQDERLEREKEARVLQLQEKINELENHIERLENEREAREREARAEVREPPADEQACWERMVEEVNVQGQQEEEPEDVDDTDDLEMRSEDNSQDGEEQERERDLDDGLEQRRQLRREFLRERLAELEDRARAIRRGVRAIPERKREWLSPGICSTMERVFCREAGGHYSDSCPVVPDGDDR